MHAAKVNMLLGLVHAAKPSACCQAKYILSGPVQPRSLLDAAIAFQKSTME